MEMRNSVSSARDFVRTRMAAYYRERVQNTWSGGHILRGRIPGENSIMLMSNDYLALSGHPAVARAQCESLQAYGNGAMMSAIFNHGPTAQQRVEDRFANFLRAESTVLTQSGWSANVGLLQTIAGPELPVYIDMMAHMSLWEGISAAQSLPRRFRHNDPENLEKLIAQFGPGIIAVDSVYSTNGSVGPLREIADVSERHGCVLVVDESHSLGTHGPAGAGMVVDLDLVEKVHFRTASLAKAFCTRAGIISCSEQFKDYFLSTSRPAIFSSSLLAHDLAGLEVMLSLINEGDDRRRRVRANADTLRHRLDLLGYNVDDSQSQIISLEAGPEQQTIVLRDALEENGIFGAVFCDPATPKNRSLIRMSIHSNLTQAEIGRIVDVCARIRRRTDMANWPSTRRKARKVFALTA